MAPNVASSSIRHPARLREGWRSSGAAFALACAAFAVVLGFGYGWRLDEVPPLLNQDEAGFGLASYLLATTGRDYFGNLLPVYIGYFDNHQLGGAMLAYWAIPFVKLLGFSISTLRLSMVSAGLVSLALFAFLAWRLSADRWIALAGTVILATSPLFFIQSRLFLEMLLPIPFVVGWLICVVEYEARRDGRLLALAAAILGLGFYSYGTARMVMPIYLGLTLMLFLLSRKCSWRAAAASVAVFCLVMIPAVLFAIREPELYAARFWSLSWLADGMAPLRIVTTYLQHYAASFDPGDLFLSGDASLVHSTARAGVVLLGSLPLAAMGCASFAARAIRGRDSFSILLLLSIALFPAPLALLDELHSPARATYLLPLYAVACFAGIELLARWASRVPMAKLLMLALALVYVGEAGVFMRDYFVDYPARVLAANVNGKDPAAFRALVRSPDSQLFYDVEDTTTTTFARFFAVESGFSGPVLPAPPAWAGRLPAGGRVLTLRPGDYGSGFETLRVIPQPIPGRPEYTILRKLPTP